MNKLKEIVKNALYGMLRSYEGKRFWPGLIIKLVMALISSVITAFFADTLFSANNTANQIFSALFFYFLILSASKLISEIKRGGFAKRLKITLCNMFCLKPPTLWFFIAAIVISLFLPYAFVLSLAVVLFVSVVSLENSMLLAIKNAVTKGKNPEKNGKGLAGFTTGLIACGIAVCILTNLGIPTLYGAIDGSNPKTGFSKTDKADNDVSSTYGEPDISSNIGISSDVSDTAGNNISSYSPGSETIVSGDTDITDAAKLLCDKLIEYAGKDKAAFEKLFRNTDSSVIDQYYNTSYDKFKEYGKSLIAIAAQEDDSVWFTALYYQIPDGYPEVKEQSVYLSTIMTRSGDGWKIEWNDNVRSKLQSDYDEAGFSYYGREAMDQGYAWAKFFIPFDLNNTMIYYDDAVMCKATEMYMDESDNLNLTFYASNATDKDVKLTGVDITVSDGEQQLFSKSFEIDTMVQKDNVSMFVLKIYSDELNFTSWSSPKITDFKFSYENLDY